MADLWDGFATEVEGLLDMLLRHEPPPAVPKWAGREDR
jgi:hypothetical protein